MLGKVTVIYNNDYEYDCSKVVEEDNGSDLNTYTNLYDIDPLSTMTYHVVAKLPKEVETSKEPLCVQFSINGEDYVFNIR